MAQQGTRSDRHITDELVAQIAVLAVAHPRSVERRLAGLPVRGAVCSRIDAAIAKLLPAQERGAA